MLIIEKLLEEYSKSLTSNAVIFYRNHKSKAYFYVILGLGVILSLVGNGLCLFYKVENWKIYLFDIFILVPFFIILQIIRNNAINKNFPKIKTSILKVNHPEFIEKIQENLDRIIEENNLTKRLDKTILSLEKDINPEKNNKIYIYIILGTMLSALFTGLITYIFNKIEKIDLKINEIFLIIFLIILFIIYLGVLINFMMLFIDTFTTRNDKINHLRKLLEDYQLRKD